MYPSWPSVRWRNGLPPWCSGWVLLFIFVSYACCFVFVDALFKIVPQKKVEEARPRNADCHDPFRMFVYLNNPFILHKTVAFLDVWHSCREIILWQYWLLEFWLNWIVHSWHRRKHIWYRQVHSYIRPTCFGVTPSSGSCTPKTHQNVVHHINTIKP